MNNTPTRFTSSIISFPDRGPWGNSGYRGNCSGHVIRQFLGTYHPNRPGALFVDPMMGGGTSRDVARELNIPYVGFDLHDGFNVLNMSIRRALGGRQAATVFVHPPYWGMVRYSDNPSDMSNAPDLQSFIAQMQLMGMNIYDALERGGFYGVLMGFWRHDGVYEPLASVLAFPGLMPGKLADIIVKVQHNVTSGSTQYRGKFVPIMHEELVVFRKSDSALYSLMKFAEQFSAILNRTHTDTWRNVVRAVMHGEDQPLSPKQVYERIMSSGAVKAGNQNVDAKIRQVLQSYPDDFQRVARGQYVVVN